MPPSTRWKGLGTEIAVLRKQFLPDPFDPLGNYADSNKVQALTRAFVILSHAELESYFEGWAKELAGAAEKVWKSSQRVTAPLAFLLATVGDRIIVPQSVVGPNAKDSPERLAGVVEDLFRRYYKSINEINGVKEHNILSLFAPLGIPAIALGSTLPPSLDSLGSLRGTHAHHSGIAIQNVLDPQTEYNSIAALLQELLLLDQWLVSYKKRVR
jgi:hypothetical protein